MVSYFLQFLRFLRGLWRGIRDPEFRGLFLFVVIVLISGTIFYSSVEGWRLLDALYFCVTTLTTVGCADLSPQSDIGKVFTMLYIFTGVGTLISFIRHLSHHSRSGPSSTEVRQAVGDGKPDAG